MPLEIKEIIVTASVTEAFTDAEGSAGPMDAGGGESKADFIAECVEQVLEILREKNEP